MRRVPDSLRIPFCSARRLLKMLGPAIAIMGLAGATWAQTAPMHSNLRSWLGVDPIQMLRETDLMGKICIVLLAIFSIASWAVIIYKSMELRQAEKQTDLFVRRCNTGSGRLEEAFKVTADYPDSPLALILREAYLELESENWYRTGYDLDEGGRIGLAKAGIERVFDRAITNEITHMENRLNFLATTTSISPFVGLFGTVWGIMVAFQGFGTGGAVSISALAPGLSTALMVTVGGLSCAIPSSLFYNHLTNKVRIMTSRMDAFAAELSNIIQKQIAKEAGNRGGVR